MKKIEQYIRIMPLLSLLLILSCSKSWLEEKSDKAQGVPTKMEDFQAMLNNTALFFESAPSLTEISTDQYSIAESQWPSYQNNYLGNIYTWQMTVPFVNIGNWLTTYKTIFTANVVLEGLEKIEGMTSEHEVNAAKGEALFYRGRLFYELASIFCPPYENMGNNSKPGIPIRTESDIEIPARRFSVEDTYKQILLDLKNAYTLLPARTTNMLKPDKISVAGTLARVFLSMEMYDSALVYCDIYLGAKSTLLDFNDLSVGLDYIKLNVEVGSMNYLSNLSLIRTATIQENLFNKYSDDDIRKSVFFRKSSNRYLFVGSYSNSSGPKFCGIATDEIYLIKAECLSRMDRSSDAISWVNELLRHRFRKVNGVSTFDDYEPRDQVETLKIVLEEREKELLFRGVRWTDLRRLNKDGRFKKTIHREIGGNLFILEPNSYQYTLPIPEDIVSKSGMQQNPGWD